MFDIGGHTYLPLYKLSYTIACDENNPCASKSRKVGIQLY